MNPFNDYRWWAEYIRWCGDLNVEQEIMEEALCDIQGIPYKDLKELHSAIPTPDEPDVGGKYLRRFTPHFIMPLLLGYDLEIKKTDPLEIAFTSFDDLFVGIVSFLDATDCDWESELDKARNDITSQLPHVDAWITRARAGWREWKKDINDCEQGS